jgi:hypothetical protein
VTLPAKDTGEKQSLADLFDLPSDAPESVWSEPEDAQLARAREIRSAPPPRPVTPAAADEAVESAAGAPARGIRALSWKRVGLGVLAAVAGVILTIWLSTREASESRDEAKPAEPIAAAPHAETAPAEAAIPQRAPAVPTDHSALVAARAALRMAETDLNEGRHAAVRARLGRLLLAIDAVEPLEREEIHAAAALLVARSLQAEADTARRAAR